MNSVSICLWTPDAYCERQQCVTIGWIYSVCYFNDGERAVHLNIYIYREIHYYVEKMWVQTSLSWLQDIFFGEGEAMKMQRHDLQPPELDLALLLCLPTSCCVQTSHDSCVTFETQSMRGGLEWIRSALLLFAGTLPRRSSNCRSVKQSELTGSHSFSCQYGRK